MGSKLWSSDMIISIHMSPMIKAYQFHDYESAANILYEFNGLLKGFGCGIKDLPAPINPDQRDIMTRRNPTSYFKTYYERYSPLLSTSIGKYQREILDTIKDEAQG